MIVRWWWIRHAPIASDHPPGAIIGWTDVAADLSDRAAIERLAGLLPARATVLTSDLRRAVETESALRRPDWAPPSRSARLREQHFGRWETRTHDDVARHEPAHAEAFWRQPGEANAPEGESFADVRQRVAGAIADEHDRPSTGDGRDVVCVAHAGAVRAALCVALHLPPERALAFSIAPLSLTRLDWFSGADGSTDAWGVGCVNAC